MSLTAFHIFELLAINLELLGSGHILVQKRSQTETWEDLTRHTEPSRVSTLS